MSQISIVVTADAFDVHAWIDKAKIDLAQAGTQWTGSNNIAVIKPTFVMRIAIVAPSFTNWAIGVQVAGKDVLKQNGQTTAQPFDQRWNVQLSPSLAVTPVSTGK